MRTSSLLAVIITVSFFIGACAKTTSSDIKIEEEQICFQGKFIHSGCYGGAMVQVIEPLLDSLKESTYLLQSESQVVEYVVLTDIPDAFKDGQIFYFRVKGKFNTYIHDAACSWPKFSAELTGLSKNTCASATAE